jgi:hypothetical protein
LVSYSKLAETSKENVVSKSIRNRTRQIATVEGLKETQVAAILRTPKMQVEKETTTKHKPSEGKRPRVEVERWSFTDELVADERDHHWGVIVDSPVYGWVVTTAAVDEAGRIDLATVAEDGPIMGVISYWKRDQRFPVIELASRPTWDTATVGHGHSVRILQVTNSWVYFEYTHACPIWL